MESHHQGDNEIRERVLELRALFRLFDFIMFSH